MTEVGHSYGQGEYFDTNDDVAPSRITQDFKDEIYLKIKFILIDRKLNSDCNSTLEFISEIKVSRAIGQKELLLDGIRFDHRTKPGTCTRHRARVLDGWA